MFLIVQNGHYIFLEPNGTLSTVCLVQKVQLMIIYDKKIPILGWLTCFLVIQASYLE